jgi:nitrate reductase gamma subunit
VVMSIRIDEREAHLALSAVEHRRQQVIAEIGVPTWYWLFLGLGWAGLGALADFGPAWAATAGTVLFGAVHSTIATHVISGRRGSRQLSIRSELVSREIPMIIIGFLIVMAAVTVGIALLLNADGARHPATLAGAIVGLLVFTGGPTLIAAVRRRAERW